MPPDNAALPAALEALLAKRLLIFMGKGGVGKSSLTAAVALLAVRRGKRVLCCEVNTSDRLPRLLNAAGSGPQIRELRENLFCVNIQPASALHEYGMMRLHSERIVKRVLENRLVHYFLRMIPSLSEVVTLGKLLFHVREEENGKPRFDLVLLDAPATGHGVSLLRVPQVLVTSVPAGPLKEDMSWMRDLLADPALTAVNLVAIPEELPVNETLELNRSVRDLLALPRGICLLNDLWPKRFSPAELALLEAPPPLRPIVPAIRRLQQSADRCAEQAARLAGELDLPIFQLPHFFGCSGSEVAVKIAEVLWGAAA